MRKGWLKWACFTYERFGGTQQQTFQFPRVGYQEHKPGFLWKYVVGQQQVANKKLSCGKWSCHRTLKNHCSEILEQVSERLWNLDPRRFSRTIWTMSKQSTLKSALILLWVGAELDDPQRSLPTWMSLQVTPPYKPRHTWVWDIIDSMPFLTITSQTPILICLFIVGCSLLWSYWIYKCSVTKWYLKWL